MEQLRISARTLGGLTLPNFCPACFWIRLRCKEKFPFQIPMPGIFNSIDSYGKNVIHSLFDRDNSLPNWFPDLGLVKSYIQKLHHSWFNYEDPDTRILLTGTPDDIFQLTDGSYHIVDYKTAKVTTTQDELFALYAIQLNAYAFIAERLSKYKPLVPISKLSLIYLEPQTTIDNSRLINSTSNEGPVMRFKPVLKSVDLCAEETIPSLLARACNIFDKEQPPDHTDNCKDFELLNQLLSVFKRI